MKRNLSGKGGLYHWGGKVLGQIKEHPERGGESVETPGHPKEGSPLLQKRVRGNEDQRKGSLDQVTLLSDSMRKEGTLGGERGNQKKKERSLIQSSLLV